MSSSGLRLSGGTWGPEPPRKTPPRGAWQDSRLGLWPPLARGHDLCSFKAFCTQCPHVAVETVRLFSLDFWLLVNNRPSAPRVELPCFKQEHRRPWEGRRALWVRLCLHPCGPCRGLSWWREPKKVFFPQALGQPGPDSGPPPGQLLKESWRNAKADAA